MQKLKEERVEKLHNGNCPYHPMIAEHDKEYDKRIRGCEMAIVESQTMIENLCSTVSTLTTSIEKLVLTFSELQDKADSRIHEIELEAGKNKLSADNNEAAIKELRGLFYGSIGTLIVVLVGIITAAKII